MPLEYLCTSGDEMKKSVLKNKEAPTTEVTTQIGALHIKKVVVCFHGFMSSKSHDLQAFKDFFDSVNSNPDWEISLVNLFDFGNRKTYKSKLMYERGKEAVEGFLAKGYVVYLLAYSYSVGIAARICTEHPEIEKLVLVSPTIYLVKTGLLAGYFNLFIKHVKVRKKLKKRKKPIRGMVTLKPGFFKLAMSIAYSIAHYRKYLEHISANLFIFKGSEDELSIPQTFSYIAKKSKDTIVMSKTYPGQDHIMIMSLEHGKEAFEDILTFLFHLEFEREGE